MFPCRRPPTRRPLGVCKAQPRAVKIIRRDIEKVAYLARTTRLRVFECGKVRMVVESVKGVSGAYANVVSR